jgi:hypothetical protein
LILHIRFLVRGYGGTGVFETDIDLLANQKSTIKTELLKGAPPEGTVPQ